MELARRDAPSGSKVVAANRVRNGGVGGFFSKELFEVVVDVAKPSRARRRSAAESIIDLDEGGVVERERYQENIETPKRSRRVRGRGRDKSSESADKTESRGRKDRSNMTDGYSDNGADSHGARRQDGPELGLSEAELDVLSMFDPGSAAPRSVVELAERVSSDEQTFVSSAQRPGDQRPNDRPAPGQPPNPLFRTDAPWTQVATTRAIAAIEAAGATNTPAYLSLFPPPGTDANPSTEGEDFGAIFDRIAGEAEMATRTDDGLGHGPRSARAIGAGPSLPGPGNGTRLSAEAVAAEHAYLDSRQVAQTVAGSSPEGLRAKGPAFGSMARAIESARTRAAASSASTTRTPAATRIMELAQVQQSSRAQMQRNESHTIDLDRLAENLIRDDDLDNRSARAAHPSMGGKLPVTYTRALPSGGAGGLASADELIEMTVVGGRAAALARLGVPEHLLADVLGGDLSPAWRELRQLLTRLLSSIPQPGPLPVAPGSVIAIVGSHYAARQLATSVSIELGLDPAAVVTVASLRVEDGGHSYAPGSEPISSYKELKANRELWDASPVPTVVLLDADVHPYTMQWARKMLFALDATVAWGAVEARLKLEDISSWAGALGGLDALAFVDLDATTSPAAILHLGMPIARLDGQPATAAAWADLLTERLSA
jgi:hypothetical protein